MSAKLKTTEQEGDTSGDAETAFSNASLLILNIALGEPTQKPRLVGLAWVCETRRQTSGRKARKCMLDSIIEGLG